MLYSDGHGRCTGFAHDTDFWGGDIPGTGASYWMDSLPASARHVLLSAVVTAATAAGRALGTQGFPSPSSYCRSQVASGHRCLCIQPRSLLSGMRLLPRLRRLDLHPIKGVQRPPAWNPWMLLPQGAPAGNAAMSTQAGCWRLPLAAGLLACTDFHPSIGTAPVESVSDMPLAVCQGLAAKGLSWHDQRHGTVCHQPNRGRVQR